MFALRSFQREALSALIHSPSHLLCIAPTGSGKSLIYERQASLPGTRTLLVTPLIALARQQYERLRMAGISTSCSAGGLSVPNAPPEGKSGAWIVSPESLLSAARKRQLERWSPNFMVVDECHCLWEWGESFRPAFQSLPELLQQRKIERSLWLTATLPPGARRALQGAFEDNGIALREMGSFSCPTNLKIEFLRVSTVNRVDAILERSWSLRQSGSGLIFAQTRETCERIARVFKARAASSTQPGLKMRVITYHAGLSREERRNAEHQIISRKADIVVATSAFGMGMDFSHINWVILSQAPPSLLALAQSMGRAGRVIQHSAHACVFWDADDFQLMDWVAKSSERGRKDLLAVAEALHKPDCRVSTLKEYFNGKPDDSHCGNCDYCAASRHQDHVVKLK